MSRLLKVSHRIHKYVGLFLILFFIWMSISGILLNHKNLIRSVSVPAWMVPEHYAINNWSRGALSATVSINDASVFAYGSQGVFYSNNQGGSFKSYMGDGYPSSAWDRRCNHLLFNPQDSSLYAATYSGLYKSNLNQTSWKEIKLGKESESVEKLFIRNDSLLVFTNSDLFVVHNQKIKKITPKRPVEKDVSLIEVFFQLHDGSIWGLPGRLLWDVAALVLLFLSISAFYIWFLPKKWRYKKQKSAYQLEANEKSKFKFYLMNHKKWGWYFGVIILLIVITGTFLRPPFMLALINKSLARSIYPAVSNPNPWHHKISNVAYNSCKDTYIIESNNGFYEGGIKDSVFNKIEFNAPVFAMGTTVFEESSPGELFVGSFGGLYTYNLTTKKYTSLLQTKEKPANMHPGGIMISGFIHVGPNKLLIVDQYKGICTLDGKPYHESYKQPESIMFEFRMPLWNYLFEIHNGRFFKGAIGGFYALIIPLCGLLSIFLTLSGLLLYGIPLVKKKLRKK